MPEFLFFSEDLKRFAKETNSPLKMSTLCRAIWSDRRRMQQLDKTARELQEYFAALPDAILGEREKATTDGGVVDADQTLLFVFCANEDHAASEEKLKCEKFARPIEDVGARDSMVRDIEREMERLR